MKFVPNHVPMSALPGLQPVAAEWHIVKQAAMAVSQLPLEQWGREIDSIIVSSLPPQSAKKRSEASDRLRPQVRGVATALVDANKCVSELEHLSGSDRKWALMRLERDVYRAHKELNPDVHDNALRQWASNFTRTVEEQLNRQDSRA